MAWAPAQVCDGVKALPLKDLCYLGGWKDPKTLLTCYQQPDEELMRRALLERRPFGGQVLSIRGSRRDSMADCTG